MEKTAIVIGGSMGGLFAANLLLRAGWDVRIFERSDAPLSSRGAGIVTHEGLRQVLALAGVTVTDDLGILITKRRAFDRSGTLLAELDLPQILTSWSRLLGLLMAAFPQERYHLNHAVDRVEPGGAEQLAKVHLANGQAHETHLVIAAEGLRSSTRQLLFHQQGSVYAGYIAWRAVADQRQLSSSAQGFLADAFCFSQIPGEQILTYPIAAPDSVDRIQTNLVWYRKTSEAQLESMLTDRFGQRFEGGIPPDRIDPQHLQAAIAEAADRFHPCWSEVLAKRVGPLILQPVFDLESSAMARERLALIGDAAFVARPHIGQGVTKAAGDALALTECLADIRDGAAPEVVQALATFSKQRVPVGSGAVAQARRMGTPIAMVHHGSSSDEQAALMQHYSNPRHLLRETAVEIAGVAHLR